jgi:hypothetical protein
MLKGILAIIGAAIGAALIVGLIPPPTQAAAAVPAAVTVVGTQSVAAVSVAAEETAATSCAQAWPYYETSCLRDGRRPNAAARTVRVIPTEQPAKRSASRNARL